MADTVVSIVTQDTALLQLLAEWLTGRGCRLADAAEPPQAIDLLIVDLPFPRAAAEALLQRLEAQHPGVPLIAVSSSFFPAVHASGSLARRLGVAAALAKPFSQEALAHAVDAAVRLPR